MSVETGVVYGTGSEIKRSDKLGEFILNHMDTLTVFSNKLLGTILDEAEVGILNKYSYDIYSDYESAYSSDSGLNGIVADVIAKETGVRVEYRQSQEDDTEYILFTETMPWNYNNTERNLTMEKLRDLLQPYFKELQIPYDFKDIKLIYVG